MGNGFNEFNGSSLAFQHSLGELFDEFTEVISGELRVLKPFENMEE